MDREARIKLIAEGASRAASSVQQVTDKVSGLGKTSKGAQGLLADVATAVARIASDAARAANDVRPISFDRAADSAKRFDDVVSRLAVRSNRDIGQLKQQFRDTGKEIGVLPERVANATRALTKMTGSSDAAEAMRDLGTEANDTDRSLEEMVEVGAALYNKLGVPLGQLGDAFSRIRGAAMDFSHVGGPVALESTLTRLAPLLARFQGGVTRAAATVALLSQGKSREVGERVSGTILGAFAGADPLLVTRKMRELTGKRNYQPYEINDQGEAVLKSEALVKLQQHFRQRPFGAVLRFFNNDIAATKQFLDKDLRQVDQAEQQTEQTRKTLVGQGAVDLNNLRPSDRAAFEAYSRQVIGEKAGPSGLAATAAGERAQTDVERADIELSAGDVVQRQRDRRNAMYRGHRGLQAGVDTLRAYMPSDFERVTHVAETVAAYASSAHQAGRSSGPTASAARVERLTVDLTTSSIKGISDAIRSAPPVVRTGQSPAAQYTEDAKRGARAAANY